MNKQKTIAFDLDDVLCYRINGYEHLGPEKYNYCKPYIENINLVNSLYDDSVKVFCFSPEINKSKSFICLFLSSISSSLYRVA